MVTRKHQEPGTVFRNLIKSEKVRKYILNFFKFGVSFGAIAWVLSKISFSEVIEVFKKADPLYIFIALLFVIFSFITAGFRQNLSFRAINAHISSALNLKIFWLGMFYNLFLPGGVGGDGYKVYLVNKYRNNGIKKNIAAMLLNRIAGLIVIAMFTIILYNLSGRSVLPDNIEYILIPVIYIVYLAGVKFMFKSFIKVSHGLFGWSFVSQIMQLFSALFILYAFHQESDLIAYLFLFFFSAIATAIPITIGGVGAREIVFYVGAKQMGLDNEISIALSLMFFLLSAAISFLGIYWVFFPPFRKEKRGIIDIPKAIEEVD